ncbi:type 2 isopentenyl-diphosphate Delta-isomerase [Carboxylicivirga sp. M1479]|uniref:type 2 isopentenyl-diphosphate Delta-isomerase n=1 Tax=Carboxylicivirga sp. M1479 TaxID=2594476 RepID=UPI001178B0EC|nr:type 2 isopentenyl-diphosphate Delta-isomerase [Carboxylicivirga sp. M1479]TRX71300.1 type 2 isopentenyl-diphosphate Delta-isomerase [Carboxylicivirga sp. M1479]
MEDRKRDHIDLAFSSKLDGKYVDKRFDYEPLFGTHEQQEQSYTFLGKKMQMPLWVSSMTGGTKRAGTINKNLAQACAEFGLGMGLGSCRILLDSPEHFNDFNVRPIMGDEAPLLANIGICQLEAMLEDQSTDKLGELVEKLDADGLIIHINPLQEAFQPEGDIIKRPAIELLQDFLERTSLKLVVKEVGQGFGQNSLRQLLQLPIEAIEFSAMGGTNFSLVELNRSNAISAEVFNPFIHVGHTAEDMTRMVNQLVDELPEEQLKVKQLIISGGISNLLDGYYLTSISKIPAIYGMGSAFLRHAMGDYEKLQIYIETLKDGWHLANNFLKVK